MIPHYVDIPALKAKIEDSIQQSTGIKAQISKLAIHPTLFHGVEVVFKNDVFSSPEDVKVIKAGTITLNIRYLPLFHHKNSISNIRFSHIKVYIGENSYLFRIKKPHISNNLVFLKDTRIELQDYDIVFDRYFDHYNQYLLHGDYLSLSHVASKKSLVLQGAGSALYNRSQQAQPLGAFKINAIAKQDMLNKPHFDRKDIQKLHLELSNVNLTTFGTIFSSYGYPVLAQGNVNTLSFDIDGHAKPVVLTIRGSTDTPTHIKLYTYEFHFDPGALVFQTDFVFNHQLAPIALQNLFLKLTSRNFDASIHGDIGLQQPFEQSRLSLHTIAAWVPISTLALIPNLTPLQKHLLKILHGQFSTDLRIQGSIQQPQMEGAVKLNNLAIQSEKNAEALVQNLQGMITFSDRQHIGIQNLQGNVADSPVILNGEFDLKHKSFQAKTTANNLNLTKMRELVLEFFPQTRFLNELVPSGRLGLQLRMQGAFQKPTILGNADFHDIGITTVKENTKLLSQFTGSLHFEGSTFTLKPTQGLLGNSAVQLSGTYQRPHSNIALSMQSKHLNLAQVQQLVSDVSLAFNHPLPWLNTLNISGDSSVYLKAFGTLKQPSFLGQIMLSKVAILNTTTKLNVTNVHGLVNFNPQAITIEKLMGQLQNVPIELTGNLTGRGYQNLNLAVTAPNVNLAYLQSQLKPILPSIANQIALQGRGDFNLQLLGTLKQPLPIGTIALSHVAVTYPQKHIILQNVGGILQIGKALITLQNIHGILNGMPIALSGTANRDFKNYHLALNAQNIAIKTLENALGDLAPPIAAKLKEASIQSGSITAKLVFSPTLPIGVQGNVIIKNLYATPPRINLPIHVSEVSYNIGTGEIHLPKGGLEVGGVHFKVKGHASPKSYEITVISQKIPISFIRDHHAFLEKVLSQKLPTFYNTAGNLQIRAKFSSAIQEAAIRFLQAGASMEGLKYPVYDMSGTVVLTLSKGVKAYTDNLSFRYGNSPIEMTFDINGLKDIYLETTGTIAPLLVNDLLFANSSSTIAFAAVPFDINLSGKLGQLSGSGIGNNLNMFLNFNVASLFTNPNLIKPAQAGDTSLSQATLSSVLHLVGDTLKVEQTRFKAGKNSGVVVQGAIHHLFSPQDREMKLSLMTDPVLNLVEMAKQLNKQIGQGLAGNIGANVQLSYAQNQFNSQGQITLNHIKAPALELDDLDGNIVFKGIKAFLNVDHFQIPGVDVGFNAVVSNLTQYPLPIENFNLTGKEFIVALYTDWIDNVIVNKIKHGFWEQFFPSTGQIGNLPYEIKNGTLKVKEGIINNLIIKNYSSTIKVYPNSYFVLNRAQAQSAGGTVKGYFSMNPRDNNFMTVHLKIDKMKANAVSQILLNATNQIFGDLSGTIDYTTEGKTPQELLSNTNGYADLKVENGRLPSVAKVENLLVAANTISGGLANLNLNSLFHLAAPFNTNYFATLTGTFKMVDGIIYTDNMKSDGKNLHLQFSGLIRMVDGYANLLVRGQMDREIGGILGPLGDVSVGRFLGIFPPLREIISHIPGIGFIPGFGGPRTKGVAFEVKIVGPMLDPGSVQNFQWTQ